MHGYDVVDHSLLNPELGGEKAFRVMAKMFHRCGLGIIVDIVPNHMAVGQADNAWWLDVLERGVASAYSGYFDIDWDAPGFRAKVLAPFLGMPPEQALDTGELTLIHDATLDKLTFAYYAHRFPLRPDDRERLAHRDPASLSKADLLALHENQNFVLADWREADSRINWRRFFDITDLAALRAERDDVFDATHGLILDLYAEGLIEGVRVDHVDGLADPRAYCRKLRAALRERESRRPSDAGSAYIVVEKILAADESLPSDWPIEGTTGYDFMNEVAGLQHADDAGALDALWRRYGGRGDDFEREEVLARRETTSTKFKAQLVATACAFAATARGKPIGEAILTDALEAVIVQMRSYRTYATGRKDSPRGGGYFERAIEKAALDSAALRPAIEAIAGVVGDVSEEPATIDAIRRFNQLSAPVAAKAVEDTAFYRYGRILSRNDVGFDPRQKTLPAADFHIRMARRARDWPSDMLSTATHDHKRGEDARARLAVLSELPNSWRQRVERWFDRNARLRPDGLDGDDEYQLYQTLTGAWPMSGTSDPGFAQLAERVAGWCRKYLREAKLRSSWHAPDAAYEEKLLGFARALLAERAGAGFRDDMDSFICRIGPAGAANALVQSALRCTLPGMPDLYQGCEFWDLSMVDPDNRRPVDFVSRMKMLARSDPAPPWHDAGRKQAIIAALLQYRTLNDELFRCGDYRPLPVTGPRKDNVIAFERAFKGEVLIVAAMWHCAAALCDTARLTPTKDWWADTAIGLAATDLDNVLPFAAQCPATSRAADLFTALPVYVGVANRD